MKIAWIQYDIHWLNPMKNFSKLEAYLSTLTDKIDLLVLPEMFDTGFYMHPDQLQNRNQNETIEWIRKTARLLNCGMICSTIIKENDKFFNRLIYIDSFTEMHYDKCNLFSMGGEGKTYTAGNEAIIIHTKSEFNIRPLICYDLRFPDISTHTGEIDLIIYVASWPNTRIDQWSALLKARAIENQSFVLGLNRLGQDGNNLNYNGMSCLFSFDGKEIKESFSAENIFISEIEKNPLELYRKNLPFLNDRKIKIKY